MKHLHIFRLNFQETIGVLFAAAVPPTTFVAAAATTAALLAEEVEMCTETAAVLETRALPLEVKKVQ